MMTLIYSALASLAVMFGLSAIHAAHPSVPPLGYVTILATVLSIEMVVAVAAFAAKELIKE